MFAAIIFSYFCLCVLAFTASFYWVANYLIYKDNIAKTALVISITVVFYVIASIVAYQGFEEFLLLNSSLFD